MNTIPKNVDKKLNHLTDKSGVSSTNTVPGSSATHGVAKSSIARTIAKKLGFEYKKLYKS